MTNPNNLVYHSIKSGGGPPVGTFVPVGDISGPPTVGSASNPVTGTGTIQVLRVPADTVAFALQLDGDAFPRIGVQYDPTDFGFVVMGDGTADPWNGGSLIGVGKNTDGSFYQTISSLGINSQDFRFGFNDPNIGYIGASGYAWRIQGAVSLQSGENPPGDTTGGNLGDLYINQGGTPGTTTILYQCTTAGVAGVAVWTAIL